MRALKPVQERQGPASERTAYNPRGIKPRTGRKTIVELPDEDFDVLTARKLATGESISDQIARLVHEDLTNVAS